VNRKPGLYRKPVEVAPHGHVVVIATPPPRRAKGINIIMLPTYSIESYKDGTEKNGRARSGGKFDGPTRGTCQA